MVRLTDAGVRQIADAVADAGVLARYRAKLVEVPGSTCVWWSAAVSGRGHGRFWVSGDLVVIAHRFAFAIEHGAEALQGAALLGHRCDNPLCQRVGRGHVEISSAVRNRREWAARRLGSNGPLNDARSPRQRATELRDLARLDPRLVSQDIERHRLQLTLW